MNKNLQEKKRQSKPPAFITDEDRYQNDEIAPLLRGSVLDRMTKLFELSKRFDTCGWPSVSGNGYAYLVRSLPPELRSKVQRLFTRMRKADKEGLAIYDELGELYRAAGGRFAWEKLQGKVQP